MVTTVTVKSYFVSLIFTQFFYSCSKAFEESIFVVKSLIHYGLLYLCNKKMNFSFLYLL